MRRIFIYLFISIFFSTHLEAQPEFEELLHKTYAQRLEEIKRNIDKVTNHSKDSAAAFQQIEKFRQFAAKHDDKELLLEVDMLPAYYYKRLRGRNVAMVLGLLNNVINKAEAANLPMTQARAMTLLADYYFKDIGNFELAFEEYFKLEKLVTGLSYESFPDKVGIMNDMGEAYFYFADYVHAIHYFKKAVSVKPVPFNWSRYNLARNSLGLCYQLTGNLDSSDYYFNDLLDKKNSAYRPVWEGISRGNLGYNAYLRGQFEKALPLFQADISEAEKRHDWGLASGSLMPTAEISFKQKKYAEAEKQIFLAKDYVVRSRQYNRYAVLYPLLSKWYAYKGQPALSAVYLDSAIYVKDSLARKFRTLQLLRAEQKAELLRHRAEIAGMDAEKRMKTLERNILIVSIIVLMTVAFYVYQNQRRKHRQQQLMLDIELKKKEKELADFGKRISEQNKLIETLEQQFGENSNNTALEQIRQVTILTDEEWEQFRALFAQVHAGYLQRLQQKFPDLTPAETRFMALAKLGFSNKEMGAMQGVSSSNIRNIWRRLRKKFGLSEEASFKDLADTV